jgi:hypothetical protein
MIETPLLGHGADFVVSDPEVTDQDSLEDGTQKVFDHGRAPAFGDDIITKLFGSKTPQPMGYAIKPPTRLISI